MLLQENFAEEHIRELQRTSHRDPVLLERAVYAFGLLEALAKVGMPFIFKGGTCLMLLMEHPRRLSTDIDIIAEPGTDLDKYLDRASEIFPFKAVEEQKRIGKNNIEKRHFKFTYDSPINNRPFYILLDVLFEHNHYSELVQKEIQNDLLLTEPEYLTVSLPSANCILADKLTAFAPHTTGIPINSGKDMEVMKQFYDVSSLLEIFTDFQQIGPTYGKIAQAEIAYRGIESNSKDCLWDTFVAAVKKYTDIQELDAAVLREFIDRIEVSHTDKKSKTREITIVYNFIGAFDFTRAIEEAHNTTQKQQKTA